MLGSFPKCEEEEEEEKTIFKQRKIKHNQESKIETKNVEM